MPDGELSESHFPRAGLAAWLADPQHVKPGNRMPSLGLAGDTLTALVAYLQTLR